MAACYGARVATAETLLGRARDLVPVIARRAAEAERLRQLPKETMDDLISAEFFQALVPRRYGGFELDFDVIPGMGAIVARGCTSTAWVLTFLAMHNWLLAMYPESVQDELFAERPYALAPGALSPTGRLTPVDGGFRLTGRWQWATGVMHSDWALVTGLEPGEQEPVPRMALLPIDDLTIEDTWHTDGMRATGSHDVAAEDVFVPFERTVLSLDLREGTAPGADLHAGDLYHYPLTPMLAFTAASPALGAAEAAIEIYRDRTRERVLSYSGGRRAGEQPAHQMRLGRVSAEVRSARLLLEDAVRQMRAACGGGRRLLRKERAPFRLHAAHVVRTSRLAIGSVCEGSGASAHFLDSPLQRFKRDVDTLAGHIIYDYDRATELYGRIAVGLEPAPTDLL